MSRLSVLMAVYHKEHPEHLRECLSSLESQTLQPDQIVIVKDGPLTPELDAVLADYASRLPLELVSLSSNQGTGAAVRVGMEHCKGDLIARADSDDIYHHCRFEKQVKFLQEHPEVGIVSAAGAEFETDYRKPFCVRRAPVAGDELERFARFRNPITYQQTTIFRKDAALAAGSYQSCLLFEDYDLWARMMLNGCKVYNMPEVLAYVRCGNGMLNRRRGPAYIRHEVAFLNKMRRIGFLTNAQYVLNLLSRIPLRLLPAKPLGAVYRLFLRKPVDSTVSAH